MGKMSKKSRQQQQDGAAGGGDKVQQDKLDKNLRKNKSKGETKIEIDSWDVSNSSYLLCYVCQCCFICTFLCRLMRNTLL